MRYFLCSYKCQSLSMLAEKNWLRVCFNPGSATVCQHKGCILHCVYICRYIWTLKTAIKIRKDVCWTDNGMGLIHSYCKHLHREGHYLFIVYISRPSNSWDADKGWHSLGAKIIISPQFWSNLQNPIERNNLESRQP